MWPVTTKRPISRSSSFHVNSWNRRVGLEKSISGFWYFLKGHIFIYLSKFEGQKWFRNMFFLWFKMTTLDSTLEWSLSLRPVFSIILIKASVRFLTSVRCLKGLLCFVHTKLVIYHFKAYNLYLKNMWQTHFFIFPTYLSFCGDRSHIIVATFAVTGRSIVDFVVPL